MTEALAVLCSDIHLSHKPPRARSGEPSWYRAMARPLRRIRLLAEEFDVPVVCAGDVFDTWNVPPELINFALEELPEMYAIPGQHDLPNHRYDEVHRSAYWTLVQAGKIRDLMPGQPRSYQQAGYTVRLHGFPWGHEIKRERLDPSASAIDVAVVHRYIWVPHHGYPGANTRDLVAYMLMQLNGYQAAVFGDNHQGFLVDGRGSDPVVCNCGTLMRRKIDEADYRPRVGVLHADGIYNVHLDTHDDVLSDPGPLTSGQAAVLTADYLTELRGLGDDALDFRQAVLRYMDALEVAEDVRVMVLQALESSGK